MLRQETASSSQPETTSTNNTNTGFQFFDAANKEIDYLAAKLNLQLSQPVCSIVAYQPYVTQQNLDIYLDKSIHNSDKIVLRFIEKYDVNTSNNVGMTLLHDLLWLGRVDLARKVIEHPNFTKINYKFSLPFDMGSIYVSALDLALSGWLVKDENFDLAFIELMFKYGAQPPVPGKRFLADEMLTSFYPIIVAVEADMRTHQEMVTLFCLMQRYGFSISALSDDFYKRLFDTTDAMNNRAEEFEKVYKVSPNNQKEMLDKFFVSLNLALKQDQAKPQLVVELNKARLDNGKETLNLPFDPMDAPCCVM